MPCTEHRASCACSPRGQPIESVPQVTWQGPQPEGIAAMFEKPLVQDQQAIPGQKLKDLALEAGIPVRFSCMQGTCGICDVKVDGVVVPACTAIMPKRDCVIEYKRSADAEAYMKEKMKAQAAEKRAAKAAGAAAPTKGQVKPTNPFGGGNPFGAFGGSKEAEPVVPLSPLEQKVADENARKKGGGGWPFG